MSDKTKDPGKLLKRPLRRRELIKGGLAGTALIAGSSIFAPRIVRAAGGSITIGSFQDPGMGPFRDHFVKQFQTETGITVNYNETNYDSWYQNCKNDGLNKTGAYDIYVMDDNWVPEFAAGHVIQSLDAIGLKVNPDILPKGLEMGLWPPKSGARMKDFASAKPELYALVIIDDVEILYYRGDHFSTPPETWDDVFKVAQTTKAPDMYGWSPRGVKGNPIMMTYLPLLNSYGGNFANEDWTPGFAGPEGIGALSRLFSFIPYMPDGVAAFDTDQEVQVMLEGKCTALTEYTGFAHQVDDPASSKVVGKINMAATPKQEKHGPPIGTFICGIASGSKNPQGAVQFLEWFTSNKTQLDFARQFGGAAVTGSALNDPEAVQKHRWLPAIADAVNNSVQKPRTPDEPKMEDILGTALNEALVEAIAAKANYDAIAAKHLKSAADQITAYLKQQGGYF
jgi:ABC-type glycerol-3-phosphate transport system substrate-binding protein